MPGSGRTQDHSYFQEEKKSVGIKGRSISTARVKALGQGQAGVFEKDQEGQWVARPSRISCYQHVVEYGATM